MQIRSETQKHSAWLLALTLAMPAQANDAAQNNLSVDPFSAPATVELPAVPAPIKRSPVSPALWLQARPVLPPQGLRAILISDNGLGLLVGADAVSIPVIHGKQIRIAGQDYHAEVTSTEIKLFAAPKGRLVWEGALGGSMLVSAPVDTSQLKYIPPMSAGVSPGLKSAAGSANAKAPE